MLVDVVVVFSAAADVVCKVISIYSGQPFMLSQRFFPFLSRVSVFLLHNAVLVYWFWSSTTSLRVSPFSVFIIFINLFFSFISSCSGSVSTTVDFSRSTNWMRYLRSASLLRETVCYCCCCTQLLFICCV